MAAKWQKNTIDKMQKKKKIHLTNEKKKARK